MRLLHLRTVKQASKETGASEPYLWRLLKDGVLTTYKLRSATYISLLEFESKAIRIKKSEAV